MSRGRHFIGILILITLVVLGLALVFPGITPLASGRGEPSELAENDSASTSVRELDTAEAVTYNQDPLILSYAAPFICLESLQPGQLWTGTATPIVQQKTNIMIHNPNDFEVTFYKKAVRAPLEDTVAIAPGDWRELKLDADYAVRVDCDDIAKLLTGSAGATFIGTYGIGVKVEGFVVVGMGPQPVPSTSRTRYSPLDVSAEYVRSSEVLKKDITYQPWWSYWWWALPWRLGYGYERILTVNPDTNIDCRGLLYDQLHLDVDASVLGVELQDLTHLALQEGRGYDPTAVDLVAPENPPALVAIVGRCDKINSTTASADYVLVSNKGPTDASPHSGEPDYDTLVVYPWLPGRWHDLTVVMPQNIEVDLDAYIRKWPTARWTEAGADISTVQSAMAYYFPYWCGWGHWWGWQANDCIDIGVGEGESIDVEQITPVRVFMSQWPPVP